MKPSPPKMPAPRRLVKAISTSIPLAAHRKASFWHRKVPPTAVRSSGMIFPGYGAAKAAWRLTPALLVKDVMKKDSPVMARDSPFRSPASGGGGHLDPVLEIGHGADLGAHGLAGIQFDLHHLQIVAVDLVVDYVRHPLTSMWVCGSCKHSTPLSHGRHNRIWPGTEVPPPMSCAAHGSREESEACGVRSSSFPWWVSPVWQPASGWASSGRPDPHPLPRRLPPPRSP